MDTATLDPRNAVATRWQAAGEVAVIWLLFFLFAGWPPPDVNESHYLAKAKHYWENAWCAGDWFLESADAHGVFYWTCGWLTRCLPLATVAWVGRASTWWLLAWSWRRLSDAIVPGKMRAVWTAGLYLTLQQHGHMAGEWVIGGFEAKSLAYAFVFLAIEAMLRERWRRVAPLLGIACSLHVLVGGWACVAAACAWLSCGQLRPRPRDLWPSLVLGAALALPGLLPALLLNRGVDADTARLANQIYVYVRLPHHLVVHRFPHVFIARQAVLLLAWIGVCLATPCPLPQGRLGQRPLRGFVGGAVAISLAGLVIDQTTLQHLDLAASLLRFYWYRLADAVLPLGATLAWAALLFRTGYESMENFATRPVTAERGAWGEGLFKRIFIITTALLVAANLAATNLQHRGDLRPNADRMTLPAFPHDPARTRQIYDDWRSTCDWISRNTDRDAVFITPRMQQTFKWYAGRAEVCCWKDVPQDAAAVVEWRRRAWELYPRTVVANGLAAHGTARLRELARKYGAKYVVVDHADVAPRLDLPQVYPRESLPGEFHDFGRRPSFYVVYAISQDST